MHQCLIEDQTIALMPFSQDDMPEFLACWQDEETQRGYNFIIPAHAESSVFGDIATYPFWVVAVDKATGNKLGVLRLSPDETPDLAIWIYPVHRGKGWGRQAYHLALDFLFSHGYRTIYAGCFSFNTYSMRILEKNGFVRWPEGDTREISLFDGREITMLGFICQR